MKIWNAKNLWRALIVIAVLSWIPTALWMRRHDDALLRAVISGDLAAATQAINHGANVHMTIKRNFTLLQVAAVNHDEVPIAQFLIQRGISPAATNDNGDTALNLAQKAGNDQLAAFLTTVLENTKKEEAQQQDRSK